MSGWDDARALGATERPGESLVWMTVGEDGTPVNHVGPGAARRLNGRRQTVWLATGRFWEGTVGRSRGRTVENLASVWSVPFDCDVAAFYGVAPAVVHEWPDDEIEAVVDELLAIARQALAAVGLTPTRVDRTGYGLAFHLYVAEADQGEVAELRRLARRVGQRVNALAGWALVDEQALDAGTRVMRLPPTVNRKGPRERPTVCAHCDESVVTTLEQLRAAAGDEDAPARPAGQPVPGAPRAMGGEGEEAVTAALAAVWAEGRRHAVAMGFAGLAAKAGVPEEQAARIVAAAAAAAGDRESRDRLRAVATTYGRARAGGTTAGWTLLAAVCGEALRSVDDRLAAHRQALEPRVVVAVRDRAAELPVRPDAFPEEALVGLLGEYVALMRPTTEAPAQYHAAAFATAVGALTSRLVYVQYTGRMFLNLLSLILGRSGKTRKDTAMRRAVGLFEEHPPRSPFGAVTLSRQPDVPWRVTGDLTSGEGLVDLCESWPNRLVVLSELTETLRKAQRQGNTLGETLLRVYDCPVAIETTGVTKPRRAELPFVSVLAASQPGVLREAFSSRLISSGLANRFLIVPGVGGEVDLPWPPMPDETESARIAAEVRQRLEAFTEGSRRPREMPRDREIDRVWTDYYHETQADGGDEAISDLRARYPNHVLKLAAIHALLDPEEPGRIRLSHLRPAIAFAEWSWKAVEPIAAEWGVSRDEQLRGRILRALQRHGAMGKSDLTRRTSDRNFDVSLRAKVLKSMRDSGDIDFDNHNVWIVGSL